MILAVLLKLVLVQIKVFGYSIKVLKIAFTLSMLALLCLIFGLTTFVLSFFGFAIWFIIAMVVCRFIWKMNPGLQTLLNEVNETLDKNKAKLIDGEN